MRKILACAVTTALVAASGSAGALTATNTFTVTATVKATCSVAVTGNTLGFGNYVPGSGTINQTATLNVNCTKGTPFTNVLLNAGSTAGGTVAQRLMANGANTLQYNLYTDNAHTTTWGDGVTGTPGAGGTGAGMAAANAVVYTVYGQLPDNATNQAAVPGNYSDTVTITVNY